MPFLHHDMWPGRSTYKQRVSWPAWVLAKAAPEALLAYVQVQALVGGTTTIQGWPTANRSPANQLLRNADDQRFDDVNGGRDTIRTSTMMEAYGASRTTSLGVGEARRRVVLVDPKDKDRPPAQQAAWTWGKVLDQLEAVRDDPIGAVRAANAPNAPSAVGPDGNTLLLELDMPGAPGVSRAGPPPPGVRVNIEPIPSLVHDKAWRASVKGRGFHGGILEDLDRFYAP